MALLGAGTTASMTEAISNIFTIASSALDTVTGNSTLMTFFCAGLVFTGIAVIRKLKK